MDKDTSKPTEPAATHTTGDRQNEAWPPQAARVFPPLNSAATFQISSDYTREVTRTTDIAGRLPNAVYTLPPHIVQAIVGRAAIRAKRPLVAACKKFYLAHRQYEESKKVFVDGKGDESTTITLDCGRLYAEGNNDCGQCGIRLKMKDVTDPRLIRLPPVLRVWCCHNHWFAKTTRGLYAWGENKYRYKVDKYGRNWHTWGMLGLHYEYVRRPLRVPIDSEVLDVYQKSGQSLFRTSSGWLGCGGYSHGQLGLGFTDDYFIGPTAIQGSEGVTRWREGSDRNFAFTLNSILTCGRNDYGKCGVGSTDDITTLTPVALPDDVKGRVDRVVCNGGSSFFISGRRCFGCGSNRRGRLGIGSEEGIVPTPTELLVVDDIIVSENGVNVIWSGDTLLACGDSARRPIASNGTPRSTAPTPLSLPGPVVKVNVGQLNVFVQLTDGSWVGRGRYFEEYFDPVPEADLIRRRHYLREWTPVNDDVAGRLNVAVSGVVFMLNSSNVLGSNADVWQIMVLPEPIANV